MANRYIPFSHVSQLVWSGGVDYLNDTIKVALVSSTYTHNIGYTQWGQISAHEISAGGGYTAGGVSLSGKVLDIDKLSAANIVWNPLDRQFRHAIFYKVGTVGSLVNPLLGSIDYGDTVTVPNVAFTIIVPSGGIVALAQNTV